MATKELSGSIDKGWFSEEYSGCADLITGHRLYYIPEESMLSKLLVPLLALFFLPALAHAESATASVDSNCALQAATIEVPSGKTATGFSVSYLEAGTKCKVGGTPDSQGWEISHGGVQKYHWSQFKTNAPSEHGGPLKNLLLVPGTYTVFVDGGAGAKAVVKYTVK